MKCRGFACNHRVTARGRPFCCHCWRRLPDWMRSFLAGWDEARPAGRTIEVLDAAILHLRAQLP